MPASDPAANRSRWMREGRICMAARDWVGAIRAYGQGLLEQPLLGMHDAANLERARSHYRQERHTINQQGPAHTQVVVAAAELSHNAAGRAFTLAQLYQHLGHPVMLLGSHFPQWGRELWEPIRTAVEKAQLPVHSFVAEHEPRSVEQAFALVLQHPADLVHLSKPRLPAVVGFPRFGGQVDRRNAMTTRLLIDEQPKPCTPAVHAAAEAGSCRPLPG
jgi:hypothetical protein